MACVDVLGEDRLTDNGIKVEVILSWSIVDKQRLANGVKGQVDLSFSVVSRNWSTEKL